MINLSVNIGVQMKPVFQSKKIGQVLAPKEEKPPIVNNQCPINLKCNLCDADFVGFTIRHLHQLINKHKCSTIGRHLEEHGLSKAYLEDTDETILCFQKVQIEV